MDKGALQLHHGSRHRTLRTNKERIDSFEAEGSRGKEELDQRHRRKWCQCERQGRLERTLSSRSKYTCYSLRRSTIAPFQSKHDSISDFLTDQDIIIELGELRPFEDDHQIFYYLKCFGA